MLVLGIETSCALKPPLPSTTAGSGLPLNRSLQPGRSALARTAVWCPKLASRDHIERLLPMIEEALAEAGHATASH